MRILNVHNVDPATPGGYERILLAADAAMRAAGHETRTVVPPGFIVDGGFAKPTWARRRALTRAAVEALELSWPEAVCFWGLGGLPLGIVDAVRRAGRPAVGVVGDAWMIYGPQVTRTRADLARGAHWLFISEALRRASPALPDTGLAHPGVDPARFPAAALRPWEGRLAYVGRVEPRKGVGVAVEALKELPGATLTIDGAVDDGYRRELEAGGQAVSFARTPPDRVAAAYAAADAIVFPVVWEEPWGLVPLEAMSVGRPVVATGTGGSGEYLRDHGNALLVPPGDAAALAAAVRRLAEDAELRARLVAGGRATVARFTAAAFERAVVEALMARVGAR